MIQKICCLWQIFCCMEIKKSVDSSIANIDKSQRPKRISSLIEDFLEYAEYELNFSPQTILKYKDSLKWFIRDIGDKDISDIDVADFVRLKKIMTKRGSGPAHIASVVFATRSFLNYCRNFLKIETLDPK